MVAIVTVSRSLNLVCLTICPKELRTHCKETIQFDLLSDILPDDTELPVRWCAPEVLSSRQAMKASDVWSYGIIPEVEVILKNLRNRSLGDSRSINTFSRTEGRRSAEVCVRSEPHAQQTIQNPLSQSALEDHGVLLEEVSHR